MFVCPLLSWLNKSHNQSKKDDYQSEDLVSVCNEGAYVDNPTDALDHPAFNSGMLWDKVNPMDFTEPILPDFPGEWEPLVSVVNQFIN